MGRVPRFPSRYSSIVAFREDSTLNGVPLLSCRSLERVTYSRGWNDEIGIDRNRDEGVVKNMVDIKRKYFIILSSGCLAWVQCHSQLDMEMMMVMIMVLMVMWKMIIIIFDGMKKRKAGSTNSTKTIIIFKNIEQLLFDFSLPTLWKFFIIKFPRNQKKKIYWQN